MSGESPGEPITQERPAPLGDLVGQRWTTQYRIERLIGCGGMGEVWQATSADLPGQPVAVKVISRESAHHRDAVERFFGEARAASALDDPNVVKVFDTGRFDDGRPALIMEFVEGPSLQAMVEAKGRLPLDTIGQLMLQAASGLRAAHARGIVHRDIKPSNLLVASRWGRAAFLIVVDFGIAKLGDPQLAGGIRTRTKAFIGTPGFVAPEQAMGEPINTKADIYSLGVVLYYTLTGRLPYERTSAPVLLHRQLSGAPFRAPAELRPDTPPEWNQLVLDCLQLDRDRRPSAVDFARQIASGLPNGRVLLQALAPSIAVHRGPSAMYAVTLSGDIATALSQLDEEGAVQRNEEGAAQRAAGPGRAARAAHVAAGALAGCLATLLAVRLGAPATPPPAPLEAPAAQPAPVHAAPVHAAPVDAAPTDAAPVDAARAAGVRPPNVAPAAHAPDTGAPARADKPPSADLPPAARAGAGRVAVAVTPFADVYIDGRPLGSTPLEITLPAGPHTVRLVNQPLGQDQTFTITVTPDKPVILEKSW